MVGSCARLWSDVFFLTSTNEPIELTISFSYAFTFFGFSSSTGFLRADTQPILF